MKKILEYYDKRGHLLDQTTPEKDLIKSQAAQLSKSFIVKNMLIKYLLATIDKDTLVQGFTLTFDLKRKRNKRFLSSYKNKTLFRLANNYIFTHLSEKKYVICPEFTKKGTLHFHGIIIHSYQIHIVEFIKKYKRRFGNQQKIELELKDHRNWIKYMFKDSDKVGLPIIYNNVTPNPFT